MLIEYYLAKSITCLRAACSLSITIYLGRLRYFFSMGATWVRCPTIVSIIRSFEVFPSGRFSPPHFIADCYGRRDPVSWRRVQDLNLRGAFAPTGFRDQRHRPLGQPSATLRDETSPFPVEPDPRLPKQCGGQAASPDNPCLAYND